MGSLIELTKQLFGLEPPRPLQMDQKLLSGTTDALGRTLPMSGFTLMGNNGPQWIDFDQKLARDQYQGVVFLIVSSILRKAKAVPWGVFKPGQKDERASLVPASHPLNNLLWRPNFRQSWGDVVEEMGGFLLIKGNTYGYAIKPEFGSRAGRTDELFPMHAGRTKPIAGDRWVDPVKGYKFDEGNGKFTLYKPEEVVHIKYWNPDDANEGLSPLRAMGKFVTAADSGLNASVRQFQNQGPAGVIYDKTSAEPWTAQQSASVRSWFRSFFPGGKQHGEIPIVGGELGYLQLGLSATDLDILESLQVTTRMLCSGYGYPAELLNDKAASTYNNVSEARKAAYTDSVLPLLDKLKEGLNRFIGPEYKDEVFFDYITDGIPELQENKKEQVLMLKEAYWMSTQDKQRSMGLEVDESLPKYLIPAGLVGSDTLSLPPTEEVN